MRPVATDDGVVVVAKGAVATAKVTLAEKAHRKGRGGRLELSFESVEFVDGQKVAIHATASEDGDGGHAMVENMVSAGILTAGLASPLFLFQKGSPVEMQPNIRFVAWLTNDATLARAAVAANQPVPPKERTDVAVVYLIKSAMKGEVTEFRGAPVMTRIVCGGQAYSLRWSSVVRLEVPPGKYWCRTGTAASKPLKKVKPDDLFPIDAKAGESYYLQVALGTRHFVLQTVTAQAAVDLIAEAEITADISLLDSKPEQLERLKAQPPAK